MKTAIIDAIKGNIMGTTSVTMKAGSMRKSQKFIVYPIKKDADAGTLRLQSDRYWAEINSETGTGELSSSRNNANSWTFANDQARGKTKDFKLSPVDLQALRMHVFITSDKNAGNAVMTTDNSGAINILN